ncbi:hypothetical protein B0H34DRAFT_406525 [Crassisporium funariophilum]|nr:hypothetical protein B0H34DRAFT_406525 [Crassisporium funariophilum]
MPSVEGEFKSQLGLTFVFSFVFETTEISGSGRFKTSVPPFLSKATLIYTSPDQLSGKKHFSGFVGPDKLTLELDDGPTIEGPLQNKIDEAIETSGFIDWSTAK